MALYHRLKRQVLSHVQGVRVALLVVGIVVLLVIGWAVRPLTQKATHLWGAYNQQLPQHEGRTNFLLLGVAGGNHEGADLTDTIIFVSVGQDKGDVALISIPRDIWVPSLKAKINSAYYYGEQKKLGAGFITAKSAVSEIVNQPIDYVAMINFANFEKVIDTLGGVDVNVERTFDDNKFPIPGFEDDTCAGDPEYMCRYERLHFTAGVQHMNGQTALKYVRSRQAEGDEGSDFARSRRQERLLVAIKEKLLSAGVLADPQKIKNLYDSVSSSIDSDVNSSDFPALVKLGLKASKLNQIRTATLSEPDQLSNPPISPAFGGQWVLVPRDNNSQVIFDFVSGTLNK